MTKKFTLLAMLLMISMGAFAQRKVLSNPWVKPEPAASSLPEEGSFYLFNVEVEGFYTGANDWETRASFDPKHGYSVDITKALDGGGNWDGKSYAIQYIIETGGDAGKVGTIKIIDYSSIWVDELLDGPNDKYITFEAQAGGLYRIGLSPLNSTNKDEGVYLGVKKEQYNDTRLYFLDTVQEDFTNYEPNFSWKLVSGEDYDVYVAQLAAYECAMKLYGLLDYAETNFPTLNIENEKNVFLNTESAEVALVNAIVMLTDKMEQVANAEHPADLTPKFLLYGVNLDYANNNNTGWEGTLPGFQSCHGAELYSQNYDTHMTLTTENNELRDGFYQVSLDAFYRSGWPDEDATEWGKQLSGEQPARNAYLYATTAVGNVKAPLPLAHDGVTNVEMGDDCSTTEYGRIPNNMWTASVYFYNKMYRSTKVIAYVSGGAAPTLTFGVKKETLRNGDWTFLYDWNIAYLGDGDDAGILMRDQHLAGYPDYVAMQAAGTLEYYGREQFEEYRSAYDNLKEATNKDVILEAIPAFDEQAALMQADVEAYAAYAAKYVEADNFLVEHASDLMGEGMDLLSEYVYDNEGPSAEYPHPNGSGFFILSEGTLTTEEIIQETAYLQKLMDDALAGGMTDGMDCTDLIKNPHFIDEGVWTKEGLPEWPAGPDTYRVGQAYTILFNVYQDITGLQDGLYELTLSDLFRPANYGSTEYGNEPKAYVYMNGFKKNLNAIESGATETNENGHAYYIDGVGYVPNTVDEAATSFAAGNYKQSLYGLVTDGTMRIGVCNDLRYEGCWAVFSDFQLTFRAKNPEVLAEVITMTIPEAQNILGNHFGTSESLALDAAIIAAQDTEGEARYDAMVSLKNAMDAAQECIETYKKLSEALSNLRTAIEENPSSSKIGEANTLLAEAQDAYDSSTYDNAAAQEAIVALGEMAVAVRIGESGGEEQDFSNLIVNRDFDPAKGSKPSTIEGWVTTSMNGYKEHTCSYNRAGFELYQDLVGLPKGHYKVTVHTYYRAGYAEPDYQLFLSDPEKSHHTTLYATTSAGTASTKVMNLCEGALSETLGVNCDQLSNGLYVPNGTSATAAWFAAGHYLNELEFDVPEDGKVRIGLSKTEVEPDDYEVVGEWNLYFYPEIRVDYTNLIVNPDFDPAKGSKPSTIEGWVTTSMNGYKEHTCSYNRAGFELYQDLVGLPEGNYEVTVHTYYRAGYAEPDYQLFLSDPEKSHHTTLYATTSAGTASTKVMNLCEGALSETLGVNCDQLSNGLYVPNGTSATVAWFAAGHYLNALKFDVPSDGKARIGLSKTEVEPDDYEVVGAWNLYYLGKGSVTGIEETHDESVSKGIAVEFYNLSGQCLDRPQPGINIVRMADGSVRKVLLK